MTGRRCPAGPSIFMRASRILALLSLTSPSSSRRDSSMPTSDHIHPTAIISPHTTLGDEVQIGPYAVIEGPVRIGAGCLIGPHAYLCGPLTMGSRNTVHAGAIIGERPQHMKYKDEETCVEIGDGNVFREHVTVHRGTTHSW